MARRPVFITLVGLVMLFAAGGCGGGERRGVSLDAGDGDAAGYDAAPDAASYPTSCVATPWSTEPVPASGDWSSIRVDDAGRVHVALSDRSGVVYASRAPDGTWTTETVASRADVHAVLQLDRDGGVHIVYAAAASGPVEYARREVAGTWTVETIDPQGVDNFWPTIAIDDAGRVHVAYSRSGAWYAVRETAGTWRVERAVDTEWDVGLAAIVLIGGAPQIVYTERTELRHAVRTSDGIWSARYAVSGPARPVGRRADQRTSTVPGGNVPWNGSSSADASQTVANTPSATTTPAAIHSQGDESTLVSSAVPRAGVAAGAIARSVRETVAALAATGGAGGGGATSRTERVASRSASSMRSSTTVRPSRVTPSTWAPGSSGSSPPTTARETAVASTTIASFAPKPSVVIRTCGVRASISASAARAEAPCDAINASGALDRKRR